MNFKEKMMDSMLTKMTAEEKKEMMNSMMDKFMAGLSDAEKKDMMAEMMPKMMQTMMGGTTAGSQSPMMGMMGMMQSMMGNAPSGKTADASAKAGFNPMDMCGKMMANIERSSQLATLATPEIQALFEEWAAQVEDEIMNTVQHATNFDRDELAKKLKISQKSLIYFLARLAQHGKINFSVNETK